MFVLSNGRRPVTLVAVDPFPEAGRSTANEAVKTLVRQHLRRARCDGANLTDVDVDPLLETVDDQAAELDKMKPCSGVEVSCDSEHDAAAVRGDVHLVITQGPLPFVPHLDGEISACYIDQARRPPSRSVLGHVAIR